MRSVLVVLLLAFALPARADVVRTLERGVKWAAGKPLQRALFVRTRGAHIGLLADGPQGKGLIEVAHGDELSRFSLGTDGKLATADRARLSSLLGPKVTRKAVLSSLRHALKERRADAAHLATMDAPIDALLAKAKLHEASYDEKTLYNGEAGITYRKGASGPMLIVYKGTRQHGLYLHDDGQGGFALGAEDRAEVARALLAQ